MFGTRGERLKRGPRARSRRRDGGIYQPGSERLPCNSRFEVPPRGHGKHGRETDAARSGCSDNCLDRQRKAAAHGSFGCSRGGQDRFKPQWPQDGPSRRRAGGGAWCRRTGGRGAELRGERLTGWRRGEEVAHYNDTNEARCPDHPSHLTMPQEGQGRARGWDQGQGSRRSQIVARVRPNAGCRPRSARGDFSFVGRVPRTAPWPWKV